MGRSAGAQAKIVRLENIRSALGVFVKQILRSLLGRRNLGVRTNHAHRSISQYRPKLALPVRPRPLKTRILRARTRPTPNPPRVPNPPSRRASPRTAPLRTASPRTKLNRHLRASPPRQRLHRLPNPSLLLRSRKVRSLPPSPRLRTLLSPALKNPRQARPLPQNRSRLSPPRHRLQPRRQ